MTTIAEEVRHRLRRTVESEFVRMEDDFDESRNHRKLIAEKLMSSVSNLKLVDDDGKLSEDTDTGLRFINTALKALSDIEKASASAISLKLRNQEQEMASAANTKERIELIIQATAPGRVRKPIDTDALGEELAEMFDDDIKDFELRSNPRDI